MDTVSLIDRLDDVTMALDRILHLTEIHVHHMLNLEELSCLCDSIYEIAQQAFDRLRC